MMAHTISHIDIKLSGKFKMPGNSEQLDYKRYDYEK